MRYALYIGKKLHESLEARSTLIVMQIYVRVSNQALFWSLDTQNSCKSVKKMKIIIIVSYEALCCVIHVPF